FDFIATAAPSPYGDARAYYLTAQPGPNARMPQAGTGWTSPPYPASFAATLHLEENHIYWQQAPHLGAPQAEGPWYWAYALDTDDGFATLTTPDVDPTAANLT